MMDLVLETWMTGLIEASKLRYVFGAGDRWKPGRPLKLCARARRYMMAVSFFGPRCTVRHARS